ncbi:MAG: hypothetical protein HY851_11820 [candidate division Zixibacteria bacterium]|nr:hypothetical protein [candidate division Zixibacteria bacterium]
MKKVSALFLAAIIGVLGWVTIAGAQVNAGISITDDGIKSFYLAIGQTYNVPEREVYAVRERRIPDEELPVVFFIARRARVEPKTVIEFRLGNHSWFEVSRHFGLGADAFYIECREVPKGPHGKAFGYYRNRPRSEWKDIRLGDDDIVNLVNVRFVMDRYHYPAEEVFRMRESNRNYVTVHREAEKGRNKDGEKKKVVVAEPGKEKKQGHKRHGD